MRNEIISPLLVTALLLSILFALQFYTPVIAQQGCVVGPIANISQPTLGMSFESSAVANGKIYASNPAANEVCVIDPSSMRITKKIPVGIDPRGVAATPDESKVYVANHMDGTVSVINTVSDSVVATVPVGKLTWDLDVTLDGRVFAANWGSGDVSVIDSTSDSIIQVNGQNSIKISEESSGGPWGMAASKSGSHRVFGTDDGLDAVFVIDTNTYEVMLIPLSEGNGGGGSGCDPWRAVATGDTKALIACGNAPWFFAEVEINNFVPHLEKPRLGVDYTLTSLQSEKNPAINEPWDVALARTSDGKDIAIGGDQYNVAPQGMEQEHGTIYIWDLKTSELLKKIAHEDKPEWVGIAPKSVEVIGDRVFVFNSGVHEIPNKQSLLTDTPFDYSNARGSITTFTLQEIGIVSSDVDTRLDMMEQRLDSLSKTIDDLSSNLMPLLMLAVGLSIAAIAIGVAGVVIAVIAFRRSTFMQEECPPETATMKLQIDGDSDIDWLTPPDTYIDRTGNYELEPFTTTLGKRTRGAGRDHPTRDGYPLAKPTNPEFGYFWFRFEVVVTLSGTDEKCCCIDDVKRYVKIIKNYRSSSKKKGEWLPDFPGPGGSPDVSSKEPPPKKDGATLKDEEERKRLKAEYEWNTYYRLRKCKKMIIGDKAGIKYRPADPGPRNEELEYIFKVVATFKGKGCPEKLIKFYRLTMDWDGGGYLTPDKTGMKEINEKEAEDAQPKNEKWK